MNFHPFGLKSSQRLYSKAGEEPEDIKIEYVGQLRPGIRRLSKKETDGIRP
jgi:hypothetical protein